MYLAQTEYYKYLSLYTSQLSTTNYLVSSAVHAWLVPNISYLQTQHNLIYNLSLWIMWVFYSTHLFDMTRFNTFDMYSTSHMLPNYINLVTSSSDSFVYWSDNSEIYIIIIFSEIYKIISFLSLLYLLNPHRWVRYKIYKYT